MHFQEKVVKVWLVAGGLALSFRQTVTVRSQPATSYMRRTIFVHNLSVWSFGVGKKISPTKKLRFCCIQSSDIIPILNIVWMETIGTVDGEILLQKKFLFILHMLVSFGLESERQNLSLKEKNNIRVRSSTLIQTVYIAYTVSVASTYTVQTA